MKVKAKTNVKYGFGWYAPGEVFDVDASELKELGTMVEAVGEVPAARPVRAKQEEKKAEPEEKKPAEQAKVAEEPKPKAAPRRKKVSA